VHRSDGQRVFRRIVNGNFVNDLFGPNVLGFFVRFVLGFQFFFSGKRRRNGGWPDWLPNRLGDCRRRAAAVFG